MHSRNKAEASDALNMHQSVHSFQACLPPVSHCKEKRKHCAKRYDAVDAVLGCNLGRDIVCYMVSNFKCLVYYVFTFKKKTQIAFISQD